MTFPVEAVPDGNVFAPHHLTYALAALLWLTAYAWERVSDREAHVLSGGALVALFAFLFVWPLYPVAGAVGSLAGLVACTGGLLRWRDYYTRPVLVAAIVAVLLAWDDWISHALGLWTPADALWKAHIYGVIG